MTTRKRLLSSVLLFALAAAGCEKSADLGRIQEETLSIVKLHGVEVDRLLHRADALQRRGSAVAREATGVADASRLLTEARAGIDQLRALVATAPGTLGNAVKTNDLAEVQRSSDDVLQKLDAGAIRVRANLAAVENWLSNVENRPAPAPPPPAAKTDEAPPATPPTTPPAAPETGGGAGSGSAAGAGSAAPATPPPAAGSGSAQPK